MAEYPYPGKEPTTEFPGKPLTDDPAPPPQVPPPAPEPEDEPEPEKGKKKKWK